MMLYRIDDLIAAWEERVHPVVIIAGPGLSTLIRMLSLLAASDRQKVICKRQTCIQKNGQALRSRTSAKTPGFGWLGGQQAGAEDGGFEGGQRRGSRRSQARKQNSQGADRTWARRVARCPLPAPPTTAEHASPCSAQLAVPSSLFFSSSGPMSASPAAGGPYPPRPPPVAD